jgi:hypothetical protein
VLFYSTDEARAFAALFPELSAADASPAKGVGADNGVYTGLLPSCGFVATIDGLRSDVEYKKAW